MTWGVVLMLPEDSFARIARYQLMSRVFPDWLWGLLFFIFGGLLLVPIANWAYKHLHWILCSLWLGITVLSLLSAITPASLLISSVVFTMAMFHAGIFFLTRKDVGI